MVQKQQVQEVSEEELAGFFWDIVNQLPAEEREYCVLYAKRHADIQAKNARRWMVLAFFFGTVNLLFAWILGLVW